MKKTFIRDFKVGDSIQDDLFMVDLFEMQTSKNGSQYIKVTLLDNSGKIDAKIWSSAIPLCASAKKGDIVSINASIDSFNNNLQCIIAKLHIITEGYNLDDFIRSSQKPGEEIVKEIITQYIERIDNFYIKTFLLDQFHNETFFANFAKFPAAKSFHHAYIGGLAEHVLDMLQMSEGILKNHPLANKDIVWIGIILHDIGKLVEFEETADFVFDYSVDGNLLGHIFIGANWFNASIPDNFPEDIRMRVTHIILSHHGEKEKGSPITPKTYEAVIVHYLDEISSKLNILQKLTNEYTGMKDFSERVPAFDNEVFYLRPLSTP